MSPHVYCTLLLAFLSYDLLCRYYNAATYTTTDNTSCTEFDMYTSINKWVPLDCHRCYGMPGVGCELRTRRVVIMLSCCCHLQCELRYQQW